MRQNKYDDPAFFAGYGAMARSVEGLEAAGEWPVLRAMLPELAGKRVLDLGCGYGWHCRYARAEGARAVLGIDLSEKMLARAAAMTDDPAIAYRRTAIEDLDLPAGSFDVVLSSLALHYVERFDRACRAVQRCLAPGGAFVLSVEHPVFTARAAQDWHYGPDGERLHWPVDDYQDEGIRHVRWMVEDVIKYHRTVATVLNALIDAGLRIDRVAEPAPSQEMLSRHPEMRDESRRPIFLLVATSKPAVR